MARLVIFDLDGTLLNTLDDLADAANYVLLQHGFPEHPTEAYRYFVGDGISVLIQRILPEECRQGAVFEECRQAFVARYTAHMYDKTMVYDGMHDTLLTLQSNGIKMAVATNKIHEAVAPLMADYFPDILFSAIFGQRKGVPTKPNPQIVFDILQETGFSKDETLYVGDTSVDMLTAHAAGLKAAGALWGYRTRQELEESHADHIIAHPSELLTLVR